MKIDIDLMTEDDLAQVLAIEAQSFAVPWSKNSFLQEIKDNPYSLYLTAYHSEQLVGYIGGWIILDELHITNLAVAPENRQQGIAQKLIQEIIDLIKLQGVVSLTLEVRVSNKAAISLYSKLGFVEVGLRPNYYSNDREDALLMRKELKDG